jgi:hypothetical protein
MPPHEELLIGLQPVLFQQGVNVLFRDAGVMLGEEFVGVPHNATSVGVAVIGAELLELLRSDLWIDAAADLEWAPGRAGGPLAP